MLVSRKTNKIQNLILGSEYPINTLLKKVLSILEVALVAACYKQIALLLHNNYFSHNLIRILLFISDLALYKIIAC